MLYVTGKEYLRHNFIVIFFTSQKLLKNGAWIPDPAHCEAKRRHWWFSSLSSNFYERKKIPVETFGVNRIRFWIGLNWAN